MVAEFPELQGVMGAYYAVADGEPADVVLALTNQYRLRLDAPVDEGTLSSAVLFIAERVDTLLGISGLWLVPTGERDPSCLRPAALCLRRAFEHLHAGGYLNITYLHTVPMPYLVTLPSGPFTPDLFPA